MALKVFLLLALTLSKHVNALSLNNIGTHKITYQQLYKAVINGDEKILIKAVKQGININQLDEYGIPLLNHAVNFNQRVMVKQLIKLGANVNQVDKNGWTPLLVAVTYSHIDIAKELIKNYADVTLANKDGLTPLKQAQIKGDNSLLYLLIRTLEKQQRFNLANPKVLAATIYKTAQDSFYGIENINRLITAKSLEQVIKYYKNVRTKQGYSLILKILSSDKAKSYTPFKDYLLLLSLAKQYIQPKYWLSEFTLYAIIRSHDVYQRPLRGILIENQRLDSLLSDIAITKKLILNTEVSDTLTAFCFRQPDLDIEYLLRAVDTQFENTYLVQQQRKKLQWLLTLIEKDITNYCFSDIIATLASENTATWLKTRVSKKLQEKIKQNKTEKYQLYIADWQNNTYITLNIWLKAQYAPKIINAIKTTSLDKIHQAFNTMKAPTQQKLIDYLLPHWGISKADTEKIELLQARIKNIEINR